jgi:gamma-glutamyltranspeptidase/glutathione hydrolase
VNQRGVVAAGHPATAAAGAEVLRAGGNAVDAAVAAVLTSFVAEPLLTGLGAGGYMLVAPPGHQPVLLDFFVEAPGRDAATDPVPLVPVLVTFENATQTFNVGASSCGTYGAPAGLATAATRFGRMPLADLTAPASRLAREGVRVNAMQAYLFALLTGVLASSPETAAMYLVDGAPPREGELLREPELAEALDRFGNEGAAPFYTGDIARAVAEWVQARGGVLTTADLDQYRVIPRAPLYLSYRGHEVFTNPPPSAGGNRMARALAHLTEGDDAPDALRIATALETVDDPDPLSAAVAGADRLGSTTHISVLDADGWACSVTCSNGTCSGITVPGTGIHLNNMLGEDDLAPAGLGAHDVGERLPSAMAPTVVRDHGAAELVVGSAGSSRIRSALLQVISNVVDRGMSPQQAVDAPRLHVDEGRAYAEPGIDTAALERAGYPVSRFTAPNLFFGGCQAVRRDLRTGELTGGADGRRGGAVARV